VNFVSESKVKRENYIPRNATSYSFPVFSFSWSDYLVFSNTYRSNPRPYNPDPTSSPPDPTWCPSGPLPICWTSFAP